MKAGLAISILSLVLTASACRMQEPASRKTVPIVRELLSDRFSSTYQLLASYEKPDPMGDIYLFGPEEACSKIVDAMLSQDVKDNIDGSGLQDGLADYAGETFSCIADSMSFHFPQLIAERKEYLVRERAVRMALAAIDTTCHLSPYDLDGMGKKLPGKMIILADPILSQYGKFDIDTLFRSTGCMIPVLSPLDAMFDELFEIAGTRAVKAGLICEPRFAGSSVFQSRFSKSMQSHGNSGSECVVIPSRRDDGIMKSFLDDFMAEYPSQQLDFIVVDDITLDVDELKAELASLISVMNEESMIYSRCIAPEIVVLDSASSVSEKCYQTLREGNLFTHNIAKPQIAVYTPAINPNAEDDSIILIPGIYVQD